MQTAVYMSMRSTSASSIFSQGLYLWLYVLSFSLACTTLQGQDASAIYATAKQMSLRQYQVDSSRAFLALPSSFGKEWVREVHFTDRRISRIDLVNTSFRESLDFDQKGLDLKRIQQLIALNPNLLDNKFFEWRIIEQTGCSSAPGCQSFYHGFVIYYDPYYTKETSAVEVDSIQKELLNFQIFIRQNAERLRINYDRIPCEYPQSIYSSEYLTDQIERRYSCSEAFKGRVFFHAEMDYKGRVTTVQVKGRRFPCKESLSSTLKSILRWDRGLVIGSHQYGLGVEGFVEFPLKGEHVNFSEYIIADSLKAKFQMLQQYSQCVAYETDTVFRALLPIMPKKVVSKALVRNDYRPSLFVVDVTGSMYPYTSDLLKWLKAATLEQPAHFVFFNDGDDKPTHAKSIGNTGGLYHIYSGDFKEIRDRMFQAMRNGGGGDPPENNFEALLSGLSKITNKANQIVMVADNNSYPRDEHLLKGYQGKVSIILCHTEKGVHTGYLNLAKKMGWSLHTSSSDISDFTPSIISFDGMRYRWTITGYERYH